MPPSLEVAVLKALAKDPDERFDDFLLFLEVIQSVLSPSPAFPFTYSTHSTLPAKKEQSHNESSATMSSVFRSNEIGTGASEHKSTRASNASMASTDSPNPVASQFHDYAVFSTEPHSNANQICSREDADDRWLTNLFGEQERNDLPATGSVSLEQEQLESGRDKRDAMTLSLPKDSDEDIPLRRGTQHNRSKFLAVVFLCFVIVASSIYAAFFPLRTSKSDLSARSTQVATRVIISAHSNVSPTQLAVLGTPTITLQSTKIQSTKIQSTKIQSTEIQHTPQVNTILTTISTSTPIPTPVPLQTTTIDDSIKGTGLNQFNYVGNGWGCANNCHADSSNAYDGTWIWDNTTGNYVTVSFTGVQIKFYGVVGVHGGIGAISLDGGSETRIDFYSTAYLGNQSMWTSPMLPTGTHTFKLRVTGTKNPSSDDYSVGVDRVDILS